MYPEEILDEYDDDGTMPDNVATLSDAVVGHRIVKAEYVEVPSRWSSYMETVFELTLDNGRKVQLADTGDCCAYTELQAFFLDPNSVDHMILGVGTTEGYTTWHVFADLGDILKLTVGWSCGNPFYYSYGFAIRVVDPEDN